MTTIRATRCRSGSRAPWSARQCGARAAIVSDSAVTRDDLVSRYRVPGERVHVAHLGLHPRFTRPADSEITATLDRLELRRLRAVPGGSMRARTCQPCSRRGRRRPARPRPEADDLVIAGARAGNARLPALLDRARQLGVEPTLSFPGHVADEDLSGAPRRRARCLRSRRATKASASRRSKPWRAARRCCRAVAARCARCWATRRWSRRPVTIAAFAAGLTRLLADETLRRDLAARGPAHAARFTWERTAEATVAAYRAAARAGGPP